MKSSRPVSTAFSKYALSCISSIVFGIVLLALAPTQAIGQCAGYQIGVPDVCTCNDPSGYTAVTIKVTAAPAQTWTVKALNGLYDPVNTALLIPLGTALTDAGGGMYTLDAKRKNNAGYWIQVTNGDCDLDIRVGNPDPCAVPEICDNGIDDDCDGDIDEDDDDCGCPEIAGLLLVSLPDGSCLYVHPTDNSTGIEWGGFGTDIPTLANKTTTAQANADFDGEANTQKIVDELGAGTYAAKLCADLVASGYSDWYLPAAGELNAMYQQLGPSGNNGFVNTFYWSSSEYGNIEAWIQFFNFDLQGLDVKFTFHRCRCVRR